MNYCKHKVFFCLYFYVGIGLQFIGFSTATSIEIKCDWFGDEDGCICPENSTQEWPIAKEHENEIQDNSLESNLACKNGERLYCCGPGINSVGFEANSEDSSNRSNNENNSTRKNLAGFFGKSKYALIKEFIKKDPDNTREARTILPMKTDNGNGRSLAGVRAELQERLIKAFGGFTEFEATGGWMTIREPVWVYDIAMTATIENRQKLQKIANWLKGASEQDAIYVRHVDGRVTFV